MLSTNVIVEEQKQDLSNIYQINGLSQYVNMVDDMINENYRSVNFIEHSLLEDPETPKHEQICFEVYITSEPDDIIEDQKKFYKALIKLIPSDKRQFFTFTYCVS
jgi:hypothetical protein